MKKNYKVIVYEVEIENGGRINKKFDDDFYTKKGALKYYKRITREEEMRNFFWNLCNKFKEVELLIYLYQDFKVIKRSIIKKKREV